MYLGLYEQIVCVSGWACVCVLAGSRACVRARVWVGVCWCVCVSVCISIFVGKGLHWGDGVAHITSGPLLDLLLH